MKFQFKNILPGAKRMFFFHLLSDKKLKDNKLTNEKKKKKIDKWRRTNTLKKTTKYQTEISNIKTKQFPWHILQFKQGYNF